jgi:hypothetical protein
MALRRRKFYRLDGNPSTTPARPMAITDSALLQQVHSLRTQAQRARRLADDMATDALVRNALAAYAEELDRRADILMPGADLDGGSQNRGGAPDKRTGFPTASFAA